MAKLEKKQLTSLIVAMAYLVIGILLCVYKDGFAGTVLSIALTVLGVLFIVYGIIDIVNKKTVEGIVNIVIGAVILICGWVIVDIMLIILGVLIALKGAFDLVTGIKTKNIIGIIFAAIAIAIGVMLVIAKWAVTAPFFVVIGVVFIVDSILIALSAFKK